MDRLRSYPTSPASVTDAQAFRRQTQAVAADVPPLFKTPSLESHLLAQASQALDEELAVLNAEGRVASDPGGFAVLVQQLVSRLRLGSAPSIDEAGLTFENRGNRQVVVHLPITGAIALLAYQVRGMPPPALVGILRSEVEAGRLAIAYDVKPGPRAWDAGLDGDLAMIRAYMNALTNAIAAYDQHLASLVESKIRDTIQFNEVRREIAEKMVRRGFREVEAPLDP